MSRRPTRCDVPEHDGLNDHLRLADAVINSTSEGVVVTDAKARILRVNRAFTEVTGYTLDEVRGQTPAVLRSGRHDTAFYATMWRTLLADGRWEGEIWNRRKNGKVYPELLRIEALRDDDGNVTNFVGVFADLTRRKQSEERLLFLAHRDPLTGLVNRTLFMERLAHAFERAQRDETHLAAILIDLDGFKRINDTLGHDVGDGLLVEVARRFKAGVRAVDTIARLGGDEFVILLEDCGRADGPERVAQATIAALAPPFQLAGREVFMTASLGVAVAPDDGGDARTLLRHADAALYKAKDQGRNRYAFFSTEMGDRAADRLTLENDLRRALVRDELVVHYQPVLRLNDGEIVRAEALVRWNHPQRGQLLPAMFVPLAEEAGLIHDLGEFVLRSACREVRGWREGGRAGMTVAVNLSACQFRDPTLAERVRAELEAAGLPGSALELEITESVLMHDFEAAARTLAALRAIGVRVSIDDFGTGFSSLNSLIRLPVDGLKVDRSFVSELQGHTRGAAVLSAIIAMAKVMQLEVTAEGVEHDLQLAWLDAAGCDTAQGYLFSKPMIASELGQLLAGKQDDARPTGSDPN